MTVASTREQPLGGTRSTDVRFLVVLGLIVVLVRATFVPLPLRNDEGGYLFIARHWHTGGEFLYGDYFVDRPPLLMLLFRIASLTTWDHAIRVIAVPFVLVFVLAGWRAGSLLGGRTGGRWAAVVAAGLICSPGMAADETKGELFGAVFVMAALALALSAWKADSPRSRLWWGIAAGAAAVSAPLIKQNLLEGALFVVGLVVFARHSGDDAARSRAASLARAAFLGALIPAALFLLWLVLAGIEPAAAWRDLAGFRGAAFDAIWDAHRGATIRRAEQLLPLAIVTGVLPVLVIWFRAVRRAVGRRSPETATTTAVLLFGLVAIALGGSYWPSYLLQLAPGMVLAVGVVAPLGDGSGAWMRAAGRLVVGAAVLGTVSSIVVHATVPSAWYSQRIGEWLAEAKAPGDTGFVAYGLPSVLESADLPSPYPYLWSVPVRTLDPTEARLRETLAGPSAPTWIVQATGFNAWDIDPHSRLRNLLHERYRMVVKICKHAVWLRQDAVRAIPPPPPC